MTGGIGVVGGVPGFSSSSGTSVTTRHNELVSVLRQRFIFRLELHTCVSISHRHLSVAFSGYVLDRSVF